MKLCGARHLVELLGVEMNRVSELDCELGDASKVPVQLRLPLTQNAEEHVSHLALGRARAAALRRVHPAVREPQRGARVVGLLGQEDDAARACDREALAMGRQRRRRGRNRLTGLLRARGDDAELVSTEAVGATVRLDRRLETFSELSQQRVAGGMTEAVVV